MQVSVSPSVPPEVHAAPVVSSVIATWNKMPLMISSQASWVPYRSYHSGIQLQVKLVPDQPVQKLNSFC